MANNTVALLRSKQRTIPVNSGMQRKLQKDAITTTNKVEKTQI